MKWILLKLAYAFKYGSSGTKLNYFAYENMVRDLDSKKNIIMYVCTLRE